MTPTFTEPLDFYAALCCTDASIFIDCFALILGALLFGVLIGSSLAQKKDKDA